MAKFFRFLTQRKKSNKKDYVDSTMQNRAKDSDLECVITHLDKTNFTFYLDKKATGQVLEQYTFQQIDIADDKNYFGLQYTDKKNIKHWLDISKKIRKQLEIGPPYALQFRVKFYSSDPCSQLHDELTRYLFVLQLKQLISEGELKVDDINVAAELAALALQGELGDYDEMEHTPTIISQYRFLPSEEQTEEFELLVLEKYRLLKNRNILPTMTDRQYLEKCRSLPDYGVDRHFIKGINDKDYTLGLTPSGILIYEGSTKIGLFPWSQVTKLSFKRSRFKIIVQDVKEDEEGALEHTFVFHSVDVAACKQMWKSCVEHHAFYRLEGAHRAPTKFQQFFRLKSRFYASFHTEYQMAVKSTFGGSTRRYTSSFQRVRSQRGAPRESFLRNEDDRRLIQQRYREKVREKAREVALEQIRSGEVSPDFYNLDSNESTPSPVKSVNPPTFVTQTKRNLTTNMNQQQTPKVFAPSRPGLMNKQNSIQSDSSYSPTPPPNKPQPPYGRQQMNNSNPHSFEYGNDKNRNSKSNSNNQRIPPIKQVVSMDSDIVSCDSSSSIDSSQNNKSPIPNNRAGYAPIPPKRTIKPKPQLRSRDSTDAKVTEKVILV